MTAVLVEPGRGRVLSGLPGYVPPPGGGIRSLDWSTAPCRASRDARGERSTSRLSADASGPPCGHCSDAHYEYEPTSDFRRPSRCCCEPKADLSARRSSCGTVSSRGPCGPLTGCGSAAGRRCTCSTAASTAASRTARADGGGCLVRVVAARGEAHALLGQHAAHRLDPEAVLVTVDEGH